ncbi:uncharacterized protein KY384_007516 [Bacidia gigantensis]|uniref:uncharacterized protein n=1 Tax=Bacidia gigantensis TaxID=2732470 RepID=UPI001D04EA31|nr:uncharacterized protein KY384_007516 [Bacidia gigantensis]KAG8527364.1 hypothetical protein KY384_007516 [Bacidia gigantensis]
MDTEGEIYSNELPVFHKERWELEFCKSLMRELKKSRHAPIVRPITSLRTNKSTAYLDLAGVEKKLLNGQYSTAREFTMDIDCLEQAAGSLEDGSISSADYAAWRSFRALFDSEYIKMKDWIRDNELRILGKLQMKQGESEDVASQQATAQRNFKRLELGDFDFLATIGKGNYAKIMLAEFKSSKKLCAVKVLKKDFLVENDEVASISTEKQVLIRAREQAHPFIAMLYGTFQTETRVYFVMEYLGGEISWNLSMRLNLVLEEEFRFYAAEVCHAIQWLHSEQILYRDLKLDNILLAPDGHIKLLDFGLCKVGESVLHGTSTFCGSPEFMAPEILLDKKYGLPVDWWAFGVMIYQLLLRQSPFQGENEDEIYDAILADEPLYPIHMPREAVAIIQKLLTREPGQRLGSSRGALEVMEQPFFKEIDWEKLYRKEIPPPFVPDVTSTDSVANFDPEFTKDAPRLTPVQSMRDMTQEVPSTNSMQDIPAAYDAYYDSDPQAL